MRNSSCPTYEELTTTKRYEPLVYMYTRRFAKPKHKPIRMAIKGRQSGRLAKDRSMKYRVIDFARRKRGIYGTIETIEYDPYRNARICLVKYEDGERRYILHALGFFVGQEVISSEDAPCFVGNAMPLDNVPLGTQVHNIAMDVYGQGALCRSAGTCATVLSRDEKYVTFKLPSTEVRMLPRTCWCTIGRVGRPEHNLIKLGKAGKSAHMGKRPHVRGRAKNAADHPQGGGEGRSYTGYKFPRTRFGKCFFSKTRKTNRRSDRYILIRRKNKAEANNPNMK
jgi:large subunit ribosomal protein L2